MYFSKIISNIHSHETQQLHTQEHYYSLPVYAKWNGDNENKDICMDYGHQCWTGCRICLIQ